MSGLAALALLCSLRSHLLSLAALALRQSSELRAPRGAQSLSSPLLFLSPLPPSSSLFCFLFTMSCLAALALLCSLRSHLLSLAALALRFL
jgi:hypothetical protein